jgi:poly(hydroxyalkanoate) depolymerase family esterase
MMAKNGNRAVTAVLAMSLVGVLVACSGNRPQLAYRLHVPVGVGSELPPLVVMLHGCLQNPERFARNTGMDRVADEKGFLVLYPEQPAIDLSAPMATMVTFRCWPWFRPEHQARGAGTPAAIVDLVERVHALHPFDRKRVYMAGLSAGAAMSVVLGATYPDVFAAIGASAGVPFRSAESLGDAFAVMSRGAAAADPRQSLVYEAMGTDRRVVPLMVIQGTADRFVAPVNADRVIAQWAQANDLADNGQGDGSIDHRPDPAEPGQAKAPGAAGRHYRSFSYRDRSQSPIMEKMTVEGMDHAWSGGTKDPFFGSWDPFADPQGPDASRLLWEFFAAHPMR